MIKSFNIFINEDVQIDELFYDGDKIELRVKNDKSIYGQIESYDRKARPFEIRYYYKGQYQGIKYADDMEKAKIKLKKILNQMSKYVKKYENFLFEYKRENNLEINFDLLDNLTFKPPILYDKDRDIMELAAYNGDDEVGYSHYNRVKEGDDRWYSDLAAIKVKYRSEYNGLAMILRLLVHAITGFIKVESKDFSPSGQNFMEKWAKAGYWDFNLKNKTATLTDLGKEEAEKYAEKYLNVKNINWK